jgi:hypothetical protein
MGTIGGVGGCNGDRNGVVLLRDDIVEPNAEVGRLGDGVLPDDGPAGDLDSKRFCASNAIRRSLLIIIPQINRLLGESYRK